MNTKKSLLFVFAIFLLLNSVIFHGLLLEYLDVVAGNKVVFQEELLPYFDMNTQFLDNLISTYDYLIDRQEIRTEYYFTTGWTRHYLLLPLMLVLLNAAAGFLMWFSVKMLFIYSRSPLSTERDNNKRCNKTNLAEDLCIFFAVIPVYLILLYSKVTHFYSLIFGFSLFAVAISLFITNSREGNNKNIFLIWVLLFFNPAIHYIFLFFPIALIIAVLLMLFNSDRCCTLNIIKQFIVLMLAVLVPKYIIFNVLLAINNVQNSIPVSYSSVSAFSVDPILTNLALESAAPINVIVYGMGYMSSSPNHYFLFFSLLLPLSLIFVPPGLGKSGKEKIIPVIGMVLFLVGLAFSMGPKFVLSYYRYIFDLIDLPVIGKIFFYYLQVLRFPHRWQFVEYYAVMILLSLAFIIIYSKITESFKGRNIAEVIPKVFALLIICLIVAAPFALNDRYKDTFTSGDFNGLLEPYTIPEELKTIKLILNDQHDNTQDGRLIILPPGTGGLRIKDSQNPSIPYAYNDALYIFYFNVPSVEVGYITSQEQRMLGFLIWYSVMNQDDELFYTLLVDNNISKIFVHEDFHRHEMLHFSTQKYLKNLNEIIERLENKKKVKTEYSSSKYSLIYLTDSISETTGKNNPKISSIDEGLDTAVEAYKKGNIPYANLIGIQPEDVIKIISSKHNVSSSKVYLCEIPYKSSQGITPSSTIMTNSDSAIKWYVLSKRLMAGTFGAVNSDYILLKKNTNLTHDLPDIKFNKTTIYVRFAGSLQVDVLDKDGNKLCENRIQSDHIQNVFVCNIDENLGTIEFKNLENFSSIDSIILVSNEG
jgi:hypothetical protein